MKRGLTPEEIARINRSFAELGKAMVAWAEQMGAALSKWQRSMAEAVLYTRAVQDAERAKADFIVHGGDVEFIERIESSLGIDWRVEE